MVERELRLFGFDGLGVGGFDVVALDVNRELRRAEGAALASAHAAGAVAVLLVVSGPSVYAVPWVNVAVAIEYGEASLAMVPGWLARGVYLAPWAAKRKAG